MPATFTTSFAARLDRCQRRHGDARPTDGAPLEPGHVYLAPGGADPSGGRRRRRPALPPARGRPGQRPPPLGRRAVPLGRRACGGRSIGVILTGMGRDGAAGPADDAQGRRPTRWARTRRPASSTACRASPTRSAPSSASCRCPSVIRHSRSVRRLRAQTCRREDLMPAAASINVLIVDDQRRCARLDPHQPAADRLPRHPRSRRRRGGLREMIAKPAHLVISDFNMPKLDGLGLLRAVRAPPADRRTAFIMLTGRADSELVAARGAVRRQQLPGQALHRRPAEGEARSRLRAADMMSADALGDRRQRDPRGPGRAPRDRPIRRGADHHPGLLRRRVPARSRDAASAA